MNLKHLFCVSALAMAGASTAHADGAWVHSVTGGGEDSYPGSEGERTFKMELDASVDADGHAEGDVAWWFADGTPASFGSVTCLVVRENRAYLVYASEGGEYSGYGTPGNSVMIAFADNGQGRSARTRVHALAQAFRAREGTAQEPGEASRPLAVAHARVPQFRAR